MLMHLHAEESYPEPAAVTTNNLPAIPLPNSSERIVVKFQARRRAG